jgi:hypothetical protein
LADSVGLPKEMRLVEIRPNQFIKTDEVARVTYERAATRPENSIDQNDYALTKTKQADIVSALKIDLTSGQELVYSGAEAKAAYAKIMGWSQEQSKTTK